ncbi:hypothetical protein ABK040_012239 [Willaertia magna]
MLNNNPNQPMNPNQPIPYYNNYNIQIKTLTNTLDQFGRSALGLCTSMGECFNSSFSNIFTGLSGFTNIKKYLPDLSMIQFRLLNFISPSYSSSIPLEQYNDFLILKSDSSTVQYYSRDPVENLKIRVSIRRTNMVIGKKTLKERRQQREGDILSNVDEEEEDTEYKSYVTTFQWQQKVFSPREILMYHSLQSAGSTLQNFYKEEVEKIIADLGKTESLSPSLLSYIQDDLDAKKMEEMFSNKDEDIQGKKEKEEKDDKKPTQSTSAKKKFGSNGLNDLTQHRLFTFVDIDDFSTDVLHEAIPCSSDTPYPKSKVNGGSIGYDIRTKTMYVMASVGEGEINSSTNTGKWKGKEFTLCIIKSLPDGSFLMKPGFSVKPLEGEKEEPMSEFLKRYQNEVGDLDLLTKPKENKYIFRTDDGAVYEYTITLYNDYKKDPKIDEMRKTIIKQLQERSLQMKRNLVGIEFTSPPRDSRTRVYIYGQIISACNFDCEKYFIRYYLDLPQNYTLEEPTSQKLVSATQMAIPMKKYNSIGEPVLEAYFSFPFSIHTLCSSTNPTPKIYFQVTSKDYWDRYRVEGYGYTSLPMAPGVCEEIVNTWKPVENTVNSLRSRFIGGSTELRDITYTSIPNGFKEKFLNKFGFLTEPSGSIKVRFDVIFQNLNLETIKTTTSSLSL